MQPFSFSATFYDLLYADKDYKSEANFILDKIRVSLPTAKSIMDLGCGTGRYSEYFIQAGFSVLGLDSSAEMLERAKTRMQGKVLAHNQTLEFVNADARAFDINKTCDVVVSLFHVANYMRNDRDLDAYFDAVTKNLKPGGLFIFDSWHAPAVVADPPIVRVKELETEGFRLTRIAKPKVDLKKALVDIQYTFFVQDKKTNEIRRIEEEHSMHYFSPEEIEKQARRLNMHIVSFNSWLSDQQPTAKDWNVYWILKNRT